MKSMEVNIALDPVNDGASIININVEKKDIGSLIIATNVERKIASLAETIRRGMLDRLAVGNWPGMKN